MNRIPQIDPGQAAGRTKTLFNAVQGQLRIVPNLVRVLGNSPAALDGYIRFSAALASGILSPQVREQIALAVSEANLCDYCVSAHSYLAANLGLSDQDIYEARRANAASDKTDAVLKLARSIVLQRGQLSDAELHAARSSGLSDAEIVEIVAHVALSVLTNYINNVAQTVVDFPDVKAGEEAPAARTLAGHH